MSRTARLIVMCAVAAGAPGCGPQPISGGAKGLLRAGGQPLSEVQVTIHQAAGNDWRPIGFGVTSSDGTFELVTMNAEGALWLAPGEYRCTLESVGAPVQIPREYATPETTPLAVDYVATDQSIDLAAPAMPGLAARNTLRRFP
jgi:hypothetical protein